MGNVEYVVAGYVVTGLALAVYVVQLHQRARAATRRARAIAGKRDR